MIVGFTGTQEGMTWEQKSAVDEYLQLKGHRLHHGCCIGADTEAHMIARRYGIYIVGHYPTNMKKANWFHDMDEHREPKPYLERNHDIVDESEVLLATPKGFEEELRSGTWATIRYALHQGKPVVIIYPDGTMASAEAT